MCILFYTAPPRATFTPDEISLLAEWVHGHLHVLQLNARLVGADPDLDSAKLRSGLILTIYVTTNYL